MKKRILSAIMALSMLGGYNAMAEEGKVEITFSVGDSVLTVNGAPLEVTAPYIVGEGTTLVPVRVITEAFGAEVIWNGEDQSVNLKYPDVDITIKIGSKSATVNTHTEELAAAPELYMDTTMVPLRFISETFGATVNWDNGLITVTKEALATGTTVEGATDMEYIGDSYYGWSIKNPKKLKMIEREFDGTETIFEDEEENGIAVLVEISDEVRDVETEYNAMKELLDGMTLTEANKETLGNGVTKITLGAKGKEKINEIVSYIDGKSRYSALMIVDTESELKGELQAIMDTFMVKSTREMYDLSNVKNGYRIFEDDEYKVKLKLPATWASRESESNEFHFYDTENEVGSAAIGIYSKSEKVNAAALAASDRATRMNVINDDLVTISDVTKSKVGIHESNCYTVNYNSDGLNKIFFVNDTFIDCGDYVYNVTVEAKTTEEAAAILKTFELEMLDSSVVGTILRSSDITETHKLSIGGGKMTASTMWKTLGDVSLVAYDGRTGSTLQMMNLGDVDGGGNTRDIVQKMYNGMNQEECCITIKGIETYRIDSLGTVYTYTLLHTPEDEEDAPSYRTIYMFRADGNMYIAEFTRFDIFYNSGLDAEVKEMINSFTVE